MTTKNLVLLGTGRKAHGLKGEVEFWTSSGSDTHLDQGHEVLLKPLPGSQLNPNGVTYVVESVRRGNSVLLKLAGVPDRTALEKLLPFEVHADRAQFPDLEDGEFYVVDLIGLKAVNEEGEEIGKLEDFYETPVQIVFIIRLKNGHTEELPYVEAFFPEVDLEAGTVTVVLPEVME